MSGRLIVLLMVGTLLSLQGLLTYVLMQRDHERLMAGFVVERDDGWVLCSIIEKYENEHGHLVLACLPR